MNKPFQVIVHRVDYQQAEFSSSGYSVVASTVGYTISATVIVGHARMLAEYEFNSGDVVTTNGLFDPEATVRRFVENMGKLALGGERDEAE